MIKHFRIGLILVALLAASAAQAQDSLSKKAGLAGANYILQPLDVILIKVFQEPELEQEVRVSGEGSITLPLIGKIHVAGMTVHDATRMITDLYNRDYLVNPQVTLLLLSYTERRAYVHGQVNRPGPVIIPPEETMTLTQVISAAGSQTRLASDKIQVTRTDPDGRKRVITVYFDDILDDPQAKDIVIEDGDSIFVFERII
ncbi:MAG: polysaccharide biosynthesis/export family protein [Puniceicoccales bacterium]